MSVSIIGYICQKKNQQIDFVSHYVSCCYYVHTGQSRKKSKNRYSLSSWVRSYVFRPYIIYHYTIIKLYPQHLNRQAQSAHILSICSLPEMWFTSLRPLSTLSKFHCSNARASKSLQSLLRAVNVNLKPLVRIRSTHTLAGSELRNLLPTMSELGLREGDHGMCSKYLWVVVSPTLNW